jgi:putative transposase
VTRYIEEQRAGFGVEPIRRVLGVSASTHCARRSRKPSRRELRERELLVEIETAPTLDRRLTGPDGRGFKFYRHQEWSGT